MPWGMALGPSMERTIQNHIMTVSMDDEERALAEDEIATSESTSDASTLETGHKATHSTRPRLADLPNELLGHIVDYLDTECPSEVNWHQRPETTLTWSQTADLKAVSRTSKHLRHLVLPRLFAHVRLDPNHSTPFLDFIRNHNLTPHITSLVAHLPGSCTHLHPAWWSRILTSIPLTTFTILCPPYVFAELTQASLVSPDSWVFNMPYHALRFRQDHPTLSSTTATHLFTTRPWTHLSVNESSSLKAYSQYEYFLRKTPSLLASLHHSPPSLPSPSPSPFSVLLANLTHFTYTAIFPFYNHVETILHSVRAMSNLTSLTFKLCPEPDSTVIDDELKLALGHIDLNDAWMEFDTAYNIIMHTVIYLTPEGGGKGRLEEFKIDDVKMEGIREHLGDVISQRVQEWWVHVGEGVWKRKPPKGLTREGSGKQVDGKLEGV